MTYGVLQVEPGLAAFRARPLLLHCLYGLSSLWWGKCGHTSPCSGSPLLRGRLPFDSSLQTPDHTSVVLLRALRSGATWDLLALLSESLVRMGPRLNSSHLESLTSPESFGLFRLGGPILPPEDCKG